MSGYERFALVLDSESAELGRAAMRLLELGVDVLYANDVDEAALLVRQESERLGALLVPSSFPSARFQELLERVCPCLGAGARALVPVGLEPSAGVLEPLTAAGAEWCLWEPYEERELRFVLTAAMAVGDSENRRKAPRIPTDIPTAVFMGRYRKEAVVHDLSAGGAYFAAPEPFLPGSQLSIDIALPGGAVVGKGEVVNAKTAGAPGRVDIPLGMGVSFTQLTPASTEILQAFLWDWMQRFRLAAASR